MQQYNPMQYLAISIANQKGMDKDLWLDRIQWVKDNINTLEQEEPTSSKEKFLYRKAVKALRDTKEGKPVKYIMDLDATASGAQLMSVLCKCPTTAKASNVINTGKREDLYTNIINKLVGVTLDRQVVKDATIPAMYGSRAEPVKLFGADTPELQAYLIALHATIPALGFMQVLGSTLWDKGATEHSWTLPDGHVVKCPNLVPKEARIEICGTRFTHKWKELGNSKVSTSLGVNITHSVDGYVVREMVRKAKKQGFVLVHIHDSFWTQPKYIQQVRQNYLVILESIAKSDLLTDIAKQINPTFEGITYTQEEQDMWKHILNAEYALS